MIQAQRKTPLFPAGHEGGPGPSESHPAPHTLPDRAATPRGAFSWPLTVVPVGHLSHYAVPMPDLDGFGVLDGNVTVRSILTDHVDWILLVNDIGGLTSFPRIFCKIKLHSIPLPLSGRRPQCQLVAPKSPRKLGDTDFQVPTPGVLRHQHV